VCVSVSVFFRVSSLLYAEAVPIPYCIIELGLGTADGLIEIDLSWNMLTGSLPALLANLPIVVRALGICQSHCSLSVYAVCPAFRGISTSA